MHQGTLDAARGRRTKPLCGARARCKSEIKLEHGIEFEEATIVIGCCTHTWQAEILGVVVWLCRRLTPQYGSGSSATCVHSTASVRNMLPCRSRYNGNNGSDA